MSAPRRPEGWIAPGPAPAGPQGRPDLEPAQGEDLSYLAGDWRIFQHRRGHRWSLDDLVTAYVAIRALLPDAPYRALDLGCGLGSVLLLVAWALPRAEVTGIEAQADRAAMGRRSIAYNGVAGRARIVDGDLRAWEAPSHAFDLITGTPPYFPRGTGTESELPHAMPCRFELRGGPEAYLAVAATALAPGGRIALCSSILQRERIPAAATASALAITEHWDIIPRAGKTPLLCVDVLVADAPGIARPAVPTHHELVVRDVAGQWTPAFRAVRTALGMPSGAVRSVGSPPVVPKRHAR